MKRTGILITVQILWLAMLTGYPEPGPSFRAVSPPEGFTYSAVQTIAEDPFGFIWFGTQHGLYFYDTQNIRKFLHSPGNPDSPAGNNIRDLFCDSQGKLWISTSTGLCYYDFRRERFVQCRYTDANGNSMGRNVIQVFEDIKHRIWVIDQRGLALADTVKKQLTYQVADDGPAAFTAATISTDGTMWLGTSNGHIYSSYFPYQQITRFAHNRSAIIQRLYASKETLWVAYDWEGAEKYDYDGNLLAHYSDAGTTDGIISNSRVRDIYQDAAGRIWMATYKGLSIIDGNRITNYNKENYPGINHNSIYRIFEDSHDGLWIGAWSGGLYYRNLNDNTFTHIKDINYPNLNTNVVSSFTEDSDGKLWVGTESGLLFNYGHATRKYIGNRIGDDKTTVNNIKSLLTDSKGNTWLGTFNNGIWIKRGGENKFSQIPFLSNIRASIYCIREGYGLMWFGTFGNGLYSYDPVTGQSNNYRTQSGQPTSLSNNSVRTVIFDSKGDLWVGTMNGLCRKPKDSKDFRRYYINENVKHQSVNHNEIFYLYEDSQGIIWIGTGGGGLNKYDPITGLFNYYGETDGLQGLEIYGITEDQNGNLWLSTETGISFFDTKSEIFRNFVREDGLQGNQFNPGACYRTKNGAMLFGGSNGFNYFLPTQIKSNPVPPRTFVTSVTVNGQEIAPGFHDSPLKESLRFAKELVLPARQNSLTFTFVATNYLLPSKNRFKFRLIGYNDKWTEAGIERKATFTKIPPGKYRFEVRSQNNDGVWNQEPATLAITIRKPVMLRWYAWLGYLLLSSGIFYFVAREIWERQKLKNEVAKERLKSENIERLNLMKLRFLTNISHELKTPLTLILSPANQLVQKFYHDPDARYLLDILKRNTLRMQWLISQIIDLRKMDMNKIEHVQKKVNIVKMCHEIADCFELDARDKKIELSVSSSVEELYLAADPDKLDKIIINLVSNAMKFTPEKGKVQISVGRLPDNKEVSYPIIIGNPPEGEIIRVIVSDTGPGMEPALIPGLFERFTQGKGDESSGTGIGLHMVREYTMLAGGYLGIESQPGVGTAISVCLPLVSGDDLPLARISRPAPIPGEQLNDNDQTYPAPDDTPWSILIVEDDPDMRSYLTNLLKKHFRTFTAANGRQGYEKAIIIQPDVILSDLLMPVADGNEMNRMLKENPLTSHIPLIILTAQSDAGNEISSLKSGADLFIAKPFDDELLVTRIQNLVARFQQFSRQEKTETTGPEGDLNTIADNLLLEKATKFVEINLQNQSFSVDHLASELNMSRTSLYRKLKTLTGLSATEFIRHTRLKEAASLMEKGKLSIDEVGIAVGFNSHSYFTHCFRQHFGKTPSEYIADKRNTEPTAL